MPAGQATHVLCPTLLWKVPATQWLQAVRPVVSANLPASQSMHSAPVEWWYRPSGQCVHDVLALGAYCPGPQSAHATELGVALNCPAKQSVQPVWPTPLKRPAGQTVHVANPEALLYWPDAQSSHTSREGVLNFPAGQALHSQLPPSVTSGSAEYRPAGQTVHTAEAAPANWPAGQAMGCTAPSAEYNPQLVVAHTEDPWAVL